MRLVAAVVLLAYTIMGSGQTVTSVKLVKIVVDAANPKTNDIFVAMDVQNDQNVPITVNKGQFVLFDTQGKTYEPSDIPFAGMGSWGLPVSLSGWAELPQRVNPGVAITPLVFFSVPRHLKVADFKLCMDKSCQDLGPVESAITAAELHSYKEQVMQVLLSHWTEPTNIPVGAVTNLSVDIGPGGNLYGATVTHSSGYPALDQSCMNSLEQTKQVKTPPDKTAVIFYFRCSVTASHPYSFALDDPPAAQPGNTQAAQPGATRTVRASITWATALHPLDCCMRQAHNFPRPFRERCPQVGKLWLWCHWWWIRRALHSRFMLCTPLVGGSTKRQLRRFKSIGSVRLM